MNFKSLLMILLIVLAGNVKATSCNVLSDCKEVSDIFDICIHGFCYQDDDRRRLII